LYGDMGESGLARENLSQAYELRDRVSDREKFFITAIYNRLVTGNLTKAREVCESWAQSYPRDTLPPSLLAGGISAAAGAYEKGAEEAQKTIELDPDFPWGYINLSFNDVSLGRWKQAESPLEQLTARKLELPEVLAARYEIAFLEGDRAGMERVAVASKGKTGAEDWISDKQAYALAYSGHLQDARGMTRHAEDLAREAGDIERAAQYEAAEAVREALFGNELKARQSAMAALALSKGRDVEYGASIALAGSGESSLSQKLASEFEKRFPEDTLVKFAYMPTLHALLALNDRNPSKAIELLQAASPYDLGVSPDSVGFSGALYPVYVRGEAYLAAHQGAEAAVEFQKILNHPGIALSDPIGALAHLQLARAYALSQEKTKARSYYEDFFTLWKDADPNIPILKQAKAGYATLQ
jgi:eukaryotic-like serine/threonine-protein kinase